MPPVHLDTWEVTEPQVLLVHLDTWEVMEPQAPLGHLDMWEVMEPQAPLEPPLPSQVLPVPQAQAQAQAQRVLPAQLVLQVRILHRVPLTEELLKARTMKSR